MKKTLMFFLISLIFGLAACATAAKPEKVKAAVPAPQTGESAVFGRISLMEDVNDIYLPVNVIKDGTLYLRQEGVEKVIKIACSGAGDFGVYLPGGDYEIYRITADGYEFDVDLKLTVPASQKAVYAGTVVLDGTPAGVVPGGKGTRFAYEVRDEQKEYESAIRKKVPEADVRFYRSLITPGGGLMTGNYSNFVFNSKSVERDLQARRDAVEEVADAVLITLPYVIDPVWLFTYF